MTVTATQVADKVREIGEREPDVLYSDIYKEHTGDNDVRCQYAIGDGPGCIVGKAMFELGIEIEVLNTLDAANGGVGTAADKIDANIIERDNLSALNFLLEAQFEQDCGSTWGEAVTNADEEVNR